MTDIHAPTANDGISLEELSLYHMLMDYRASAGLAPIPLSLGLTVTAGRHAVDTRDNIWGTGMVLPDGANLHSWSDAPYFSDHRDPEVMWEAPQRLGTSYTGSGYEISAAGYGDITAALVGWQGSSGHDDVIMNRSIWSSLTWNAIGIGVDSTTDTSLPYFGRVYHVWFGRQADPGGAPVIRDTAAAERIVATSFDDRIVSGRGADLIEAGAGGDVIVLGGATVFGSDLVALNASGPGQVGTGERVALDGLTRIDAVTRGGAGADRVELSEAGDGFFLHDAFSQFHDALGLAPDAAGRPGTARFSGIEEIAGLGGDDVIDLTSTDYSLAGQSLRIEGGAGNDVIWGADSDDVILGGTGNDTLFGGAGQDEITGGAGADQFQFTISSAMTTITDFDPAEGDRLRFFDGGGAAFDPASLALRPDGIAITATGAAGAVIEIALATSAAAFTLTLAEIASATDFA